MVKTLTRNNIISTKFNTVISILMERKYFLEKFLDLAKDIVDFSQTSGFDLSNLRILLPNIESVKFVFCQLNFIVFLPGL